MTASVGGDRDAPAKPETPASDRDLRRGTLQGIPFRLIRAVLLRLVRLVLGVRVDGLANVPMSGAVVVVSNHLHNADPILLSIAFPRPVHFMAKKETFANPIVAAIIRRVGAFPVDRGKADRTAIRRAEATLAQGIPVGIFPEGTRSRVGAMQQAQSGAALLALRSGAPVLPVAIVGSEGLPFNGGTAGKRERTVPSEDRGRGVLIRFGQPFVLPREVDGRRLTTEEATARMMREVAALLPPAYRGHYAAAAEEDGATDAPGEGGRSG